MDAPVAAKQISITSHQQYDSHVHLSPSTVNPTSPLAQFQDWFSSALASGVKEPEAMALSTATASAVPSTRIVLFKQLDSRGFIFFTNYESRKSSEMDENPNASLAFYWREVSRQVRAVGKVEKLGKEESKAYFDTRPIGSRIGAWASPQSQIVNEGELEERFKAVQERFGLQSDGTIDPSVDVPLPDFWGGWRIVPDEVEFWAGKPSRLHDRVRYRRAPDSPEASPLWIIERLGP